MDPPAKTYSEDGSDDTYHTATTTDNNMMMEVVAEDVEAPMAAAVAAEDEDETHHSGVAPEEEEEVMVDAVVVDEADDDDDDDDNPDGASGAGGDAVMVEAEDVAAVVVPEAAEAVVEVGPTPVATPAAPAAVVVASAAPVSKTKSKSKSKTPTKKKKKSTATKSSTGKKSSSKSSATPATGSKSAASSTTKKKKKKKKASGSSKAKSSMESALWARVPPVRLDAAAKARQLLVDSVPTLPFVSSDIHVRSFGRLSIEPYSDRGSKFSRANALYPVGFSCDRYEFSPVHGRILKMRCSILDGRNIVAKQVQMGVPNPRTDLPDGPIFRIMWGQGIDEDVEQAAYAYDPYAMSPPLSSSGEVDAVAVPTSAPSSNKGPGVPRVGMRVKAAFDHNQFFQGTITRVVTPDEATAASSSSKKKKRKKQTIEILYDDGSKESVSFPDPDISLMSPGEFPPNQSYPSPSVLPYARRTD